jgi:hypothetical protein
LRLRDELGGELLERRVEDLDVAAASWVEARLGPLTAALIVDDLDAAAAAVATSERLAPTVWLVKAGAILDVEPPAELGDSADVVSPEAFGLRITRRLARPSLGRRARREIREIHDAIGAMALRSAGSPRAQIASWRRKPEVVEAHVDALTDVDPATEHAQLRELARLEQPLNDDGATAQPHRSHASIGCAGLADVALLAGTDHTARAAGSRLASGPRGRSATRADRRCADDRRAIDVRSPPGGLQLAERRASRAPPHAST